MRTTALATVALTAAITAGATVATAQSRPSPHDNDPSKITISCYRGALSTVAWDRPNSVFIQDLIQIGYTRAEATVIGEHICRDEYGVRNPSHQLAQLREILATDPPG